jgi:hypothetical protein
MIEARLYCNHCPSLFWTVAERQEHERESHKSPSRMEVALRSLVDRDVSYHGSEIRITCTSHADAIRRVADARLALAELSL